MRRVRALALFLSVVTVLSLCGCGGQGYNMTSADIYTDAEGQVGLVSDSLGEVSSKEKSTGNKKASSKKQSSGKASSKKSATPKTVSVNKIFARQKQAEYYTLKGRAFFSDSMTIKLPYSCSSVEFTLECQGDVVMNFTTGYRTVWVDIYVDGKVVDGGRTPIDEKGDYTVATGLPEGKHTFKIVRQTEMEAGSFTLKYVSAGGAKLCSAEATGKKLLIEAIGDAALVGYGVLLEDEFFSSSQYSSDVAKLGEYQNGRLTYPALAADMLNADCTLMARQGLGIATSYHNDMDIGRLNGFYQYYDVNSKFPYDYSRQADVIVVDGGFTDINDSLLKKVSYNGKEGLTAADAVKINVEFFRMLKDKNPNAKIIWCYGLLNESREFEEHINNVVKTLGGEDEGYYTLRLETTTRKAYPSKTEHSNAARRLVSKIKEIL